MMYLLDSFTVGTWRPDDRYCCERCVFGRGQHADWCAERERAEHERESHDN